MMIPAVAKMQIAVTIPGPILLNPALAKHCCERNVNRNIPTIAQLYCVLDMLCDSYFNS